MDFISSSFLDNTLTYSLSKNKAFFLWFQYHQKYHEKLQHLQACLDVLDIFTNFVSQRMRVMKLKIIKFSLSMTNSSSGHMFHLLHIFITFSPTSIFRRFSYFVSMHGRCSASCHKLYSSRALYIINFLQLHVFIFDGNIAIFQILLFPLWIQPPFFI